MPSERPNRALLYAGAGLLLACVVGMAWVQLRKPCPCRDHADGEGPLEAVAKASAAMKGAVVGDDQSEADRA